MIGSLFWPRGPHEETASAIRAMRLVRDLIQADPTGGPLNAVFVNAADYALGYCAGRLDVERDRWAPEVTEAARELVPLLRSLSIERRAEVLAQGRRLANPSQAKEWTP